MVRARGRPVLIGALSTSSSARGTNRTHEDVLGCRRRPHRAGSHRQAIRSGPRATLLSVSGRGVRRSKGPRARAARRTHRPSATTCRTAGEVDCVGNAAAIGTVTASSPATSATHADVHQRKPGAAPAVVMDNIGAMQLTYGVDPALPATAASTRTSRRRDGVPCAGQSPYDVNLLVGVDRPTRRWASQS